MKSKLSLTKLIAAKTATVATCLGFIATPHLNAQSADVFQTLQGSTQAQTTGDQTKSAPDIEALKSKPSRFAVASIESYTSARMADFYMKDRAIDPFGLHQDPDFKPINKNPTIVKRVTTALPSIALSEIIKGIKVSTIMVKEKSFLVQDRVFKETEEFAITYEAGGNKRLKVIEVDPKHIIFKDLDTGEEATLRIEVLPFGMSSGDERLRPEGMISPTKDQPLILEIK